MERCKWQGKAFRNQSLRNMGSRRRRGVSFVVVQSQSLPPVKGGGLGQQEEKIIQNLKGEEDIWQEEKEGVEALV